MLKKKLLNNPFTKGGENSVISEKVNKVNRALGEDLWMNFTLYGTSSSEVELRGRVDEDLGDKIKIVFMEPCMIACASTIQYMGEDGFIEILEGKEAQEINNMYGITQGNYIFKLMNTDVKGPMYIIAKDIDVVTYW